MMEAKVFEAAGRRYEVAQASALEQDELLTILSKRLILSSLAAKKEQSELNENSVFVMLIALPSEEKAKVVRILTGKAFEVGSSLPVSVKDFQGKIVAWNKFLAKLIIWNLADFFELLSSVDLEDALRAKPKSQEAGAP